MTDDLRRCEYHLAYRFATGPMHYSLIGTELIEARKVAQSQAAKPGVTDVILTRRTITDEQIAYQ